MSSLGPVTKPSLMPELRILENESNLDKGAVKSSLSATWNSSQLLGLKFRDEQHRPEDPALCVHVEEAGGPAVLLPELEVVVGVVLQQQQVVLQTGVLHGEPANLFCFVLFGWSRGPGRYPIFPGVTCHMECTANHVRGSLGARDLTIFAKHVFCKGRFR